MKKIIILVLSAALLSGCDEVAERKNPEAEKLESEYLGTAGGVSYSVVKVDGHEYVSAYGVKCVSLVHSESCPCKGGAPAKPAAFPPVQ
jgi:hypothetical protein